MKQSDISDLLDDLAFWTACQHRALELGDQERMQTCAQKIADIQQRLSAELQSLSYRTSLRG